MIKIYNRYDHTKYFDHHVVAALLLNIGMSFYCYFLLGGMDETVHLIPKMLLMCNAAFSWLVVAGGYVKPWSERRWRERQNKRRNKE